MNLIKPNNKKSLYSISGDELRVMKISGGIDDDAWERELTRGGKI